MLNSQKLLYILPDVAYIAELLPGKKEHTFVVQSFRQINGEFLDDSDFIDENIERLVGKIDPEEYYVILPDFLFTNTIVEVKETAESKVKAYIKDQLLPNLEITKESHVFDYFILTQHHEKTKVQFSAIEKVALVPLIKAFAERHIVVKGITSLSWSLKSVISLEPSICVTQMGSFLYTALHYIGVDQTISSSVDEVENVGETIKTLKGGEPSIQTVYLLTNELITEKLKEYVSSTLPLQQLSSFSETESQMPSYVKHVIESGMRSLNIKEYQVPLFELPKIEEIPSENTRPASKSEAKKPEVETDLPAPTPLPTGVKAEAATVAAPLKTLLEDLNDADEVKKDTDGDSSDAVDKASLETSNIESEVKQTETTVTKTESVVIQQEPVESDSVSSTDKALTTEETVHVVATSSTTPTVDVEAIDVRQFASESTEELSSESRAGSTSSSESMHETTTAAISESSGKPETVLKHKSEVGSFLKMVFITVAVFFTTIGVGVGVGLGVLSLTQKSANQEVTPLTSPIPSASPVVTTSPSPSPTASSSASLKRCEISILVVNATSIAGHAGKTKKQLEDAGFKKVVASNAKGTYEKGFYVLQKVAQPELVKLLESDTKLTLTPQTSQPVEDPKGEYGAVIVLAE